MRVELDYGVWCRGQEAGDRELDAISARFRAMPRAPLVSVLLVAGELDELWVGAGVTSVARQAYPRWELCAGQVGTRTAIGEVLATRMPDETRIRTSAPIAGESASAALARALSVATGDYVLVLNEGDELSRDALLRVVEAVHETDADLAYSNEDLIDAGGGRSHPVFKSGFSPDRLLSAPDLGRVCAMRRALVDAAGGLRPSLGPVAEHDLLLRVAERSRRVVHLPQILYHRRVLSDANRRIVWRRPAAPPADATVAVVQAALDRRGEPGAARTDRDSGGTVRVIRRAPADARATLILNSDRVTSAMPLPRQLERRSTVQVDEVIVAGERPGRKCPWPVVEDASRARAANRAAARASGDVLVFCAHTAALPANTGRRWVGELVAQATRPGIGAVSGTVVDPDGCLRHGGLRVDLEGLAGPPSQGSDVERLDTRAPINPGGASGDLLAIERTKFVDAGGFDAEYLPGALFALDLAFRLEDEGLLSVHTPAAQIVCRDSQAFPAPEEAEYMWSRWSSKINRLLDYECAPVDSGRSPLAPRRARYASFTSGLVMT